MKQEVPHWLKNTLKIATEIENQLSREEDDRKTKLDRERSTKKEIVEHTINGLKNHWSRMNLDQIIQDVSLFIGMQGSYITPLEEVEQMGDIRILRKILIHVDGNDSETSRSYPHERHLFSIEINSKNRVFATYLNHSKKLSPLLKTWAQMPK